MVKLYPMIIFLGAFLFLVSGCNSHIVIERPKKEIEQTEEERQVISLIEYESIQEKMSYEEVVKIIGSEGFLLVEDKQRDKEVYVWEGSKPSIRGLVIFYDGKVQAKEQEGLK